MGYEILLYRVHVCVYVYREVHWECKFFFMADHILEFLSWNAYSLENNGEHL